MGGARRLGLGVIVVAIWATLAEGRADAVQFSLWKQQFTLNIVETMITAYHGDIGPGLQVETDTAGKRTNQLRFVDLTNRLNVDLIWRHFRLWTRFDTAAYLDRPDGAAAGLGADSTAQACGPDDSTPLVLRSRYCQKPFWVEKFALEYLGRNLEVTAGDFYVSFGRGLVLSIRKLDELGIDTTLRGGKLLFRSGKFSMTLVAGVTNIQNVDQATARYAADPNDLIGGGRMEYRFLDKVNVGLHVVGGQQASTEAAVQPKRQDFHLMYGGSIDAPKLARWLGVYFEGAGQLTSTSDKRSAGVALYGALTGYFKSVVILLEAKLYRDYQPWHSSVPSSYVEFAPISYINPPTAERIVTELLAPLFSVGGIRGRAEWRVNEHLQLFISTAYFEDTSIPTQPFRLYDPYGGVEIRWQNGSSHLFPSGGFREEQDRSTGGMHAQIGHVEWDFTQKLPKRWSIESQGFAYFRREDLVTSTTSTGLVYHPTWTEGTSYLALKWTPYLVLAGGYEWTTRPSADRTHHFFNGSVQWNITTSSSIRVFVGGNRGGLRCISGICRDFPAFSGAKLELVVRL